MNIEVKTITPEYAAELLGNNSINRHIRKQHVVDLARAMKHGEWMLNGEAIRVSKSGQLLDAQHRLLAVIEADTPIESVVITGLDDEVMHTVDRGKARSLGDTLRIAGHKDPLILAAMLGFLWRLENGIAQQITMKPNVFEALALLKEEPGLTEHTIHVQRYVQQWRGAPSAFAAMSYYLSNFDADAAEVYIDIIEQRNGELNSAPWTVAKWMDSQPRHRPVPLMAIMIKGFNAYLSGENVAHLQWRPIGKNPEPFPTPAALVSVG